MSEEKQWEQAANDPAFKQEMKNIAAVFDITLCDSCNDDFSVEKDFIICDNDSQIADDWFEESPIDPTTCDNDGWMKIEHNLGRYFKVHGSCFLDHDDILVPVIQDKGDMNMDEW